MLGEGDLWQDTNTFISSVCSLSACLFLSVCNHFNLSFHEKRGKGAGISDGPEMVICAPAIMVCELGLGMAVLVRLHSSMTWSGGFPLLLRMCPYATTESGHSRTTS